MEDSLYKEGRNICNTIEQIIYESEEFLINKYKLFCNYCLSLGKDNVDSQCKGFYEKCENYLKRLESNSNKMDIRNIRLNGI